jgi:hypothetical protein
LEDQRCRNLNHRMALEVEDHRCNAVTIRMEDPRCNSLPGRW